jgi:hypothetical protein
MQDEPIVTRILVSMIQSRSICKLLRTLEQLDFQCDSTQHNNNDHIDTYYSVKTNRISKRTIKNIEFSDRWIN